MPLGIWPEGKDHLSWLLQIQKDCEIDPRTDSESEISVYLSFLHSFESLLLNIFILQLFGNISQIFTENFGQTLLVIRKKMDICP